MAPGKSEVVRRTLAGIRKTRATPPRRVRPLRLVDVHTIVTALRDEATSPRAPFAAKVFERRNSAVLLLLIFGALRSDELTRPGPRGVGAEFGDDVGGEPGRGGGGADHPVHPGPGQYLIGDPPRRGQRPDQRLRRIGRCGQVPFADVTGKRRRAAQQPQHTGVTAGVGGVDDFPPPHVSAERADLVVAAPGQAPDLPGGLLVGSGPPDRKVQALRFLGDIRELQVARSSSCALVGPSTHRTRHDADSHSTATGTVASSDSTVAHRAAPTDRERANPTPTPRT